MDLSIDTLNIPASNSTIAGLFQDHEEFVRSKRELQDFILFDKVIEWDIEKENSFISSNPNSYVVYMTLGEYYLKLGDTEQSEIYLEKAINCEVASLDEAEKIKALITLCDE